MGFQHDDDDDYQEDGHGGGFLMQSAEIVKVSSRLYLDKNMIDGYFLREYGSCVNAYVLLKGQELLAEEFVTARARQDAERWLADLVSRLHDKQKPEP